jgi:hypothetical protein
MGVAAAVVLEEGSDTTGCAALGVVHHYPPDLPMDVAVPVERLTEKLAVAGGLDPAH